MKRILCFLVIIMMFGTSACGKKKSESTEKEISDVSVTTEYELINYSLEDLAKNSDVIVLAEYKEEIKNDNYIEFKFSVENVICGQVNDEEIYLFTIPARVTVKGKEYSFTSGENKYSIGQKYILILERFQMLFYDHDRYQQAADLMLCPAKGLYILNGDELGYSDEKTFEEDVKKFYVKAEHEPLPEKKEYSSAEEQMEEESYVVATVMINSLVAEGIYHNGNNYRCKIEKFEKNTCTWLREGMEIEIVLERGIVEKGKTYRIGFIPADKNSESLIFIQTALGTIKEAE